MNEIFLVDDSGPPLQCSFLCETAGGVAICAVCFLEVREERG